MRVPYARALSALVLLAACDSGGESSRRMPRTRADSAAAGVAGDAGVVAGAGGAAGAAGETSVGAKTPGSACPQTGLWTSCAIFDRLDRAGLAPRRDTGRVTQPPLSLRGERLRVGAAELDLFIYASADQRARDEARLDRGAFVAYDAPLGMQPLPTLISSANLIAVLHSRNDHLRERVSDALTAGPPQPSTP